jgi:hypothetical protein
MFVRGLQGSYNLYAPKYGVHVPHGDLLVFGLCCGQIMYAWLVSPETIPREYNAWCVSLFVVMTLLIEQDLASIKGPGACSDGKSNHTERWDDGSGPS